MDIKAIRRANLELLIEEAGSKIELAKRTGLRANTLSQVHSSGGAAKPIGHSIASKLESGMDKPSGWMDQDHSMTNISNADTGGRRVRLVRVLSWAQAGSTGGMELEDNSLSNDRDDDQACVFAAGSIGDAAFALRVRGDSMVDPAGGRSYPEGCIIVVDPARKAKPGDRVIVKNKSAAEAVFKQLEFDGERYFLKPLNPRYPISPMADDAKIIGVVVLTQIEE